MPTKSSTLINHFCNELAELLLSTSVKAWDEAQQLGLVFPGQAVALSTQSLVAAEVANIAAQIAEGARFSAEQLRQFELFETKYRRAVGNQYSKLRPETLGDVREIPIDELYVASNLSSVAASNFRATINRADLLASSFRSVILGNPGGGKSTFARKLCNELYTSYEAGVFGGRQLTPVMVVLREYAKYSKLTPCSILEFINLRCKAELQIEPLQDAIRYMLVTGRAVVIFDGLDELMDTNDRFEVKLKVERFVDQYQAVPILVTSREVGYEQAPLDQTKFEVYRLESFTDDQVATYAHKWFNINHDPILDKDGMRAKAFVRDSALVLDLRKNPLIMGLLCSLYKQDGYLPSNRPEVYKRCADLLFEKWDRSRGIVVSLPIEKKLRPAMGHLAHWIYADKTLQAGVSESSLITQTADYLGKWCADIDEALDTSQQFVSFFKGRAWVFSDTGSSKDQPLYGFTHNTFLEFFTAEHLVKNSSTAKALRDYLLPRLVSREWDVVCQLAYQMYSEMRNAADELTIELLESATQLAYSDQARLASFLARSLDFIFPSRVVRTSAIVFCMQTVYLALGPVESSRGSESNKELASETLDALVSCIRDMLPLHESVMSTFLSERANTVGDLDVRAQVLCLIDIIDSFSEQAGDAKLAIHAETWARAKSQLIEETVATRTELMPSSLELAISSWWVKEINVKALFELHGVPAVLAAPSNPLLSWGRMSIAEYLMNVNIEERWVEEAFLSERFLAEGCDLSDLVLQNSESAAEFVSGIKGNPLWLWGQSEGRWPEELKLKNLTLVMLTCSGSPKLPAQGEMFSDIRLIRSAKGDELKSVEARELMLTRGFAMQTIELVLRQGIDMSSAHPEATDFVSN